MATQNAWTLLPYSLRYYADQLDRIQRSLSNLADQAGEYKYIMSRMASNVHSASTVLRSASHVINSLETQKEHAADKAERKAKTRGASQ